MIDEKKIKRYDIVRVPKLLENFGDDRLEVHYIFAGIVVGIDFDCCLPHQFDISDCFEYKKD